MPDLLSYEIVTDFDAVYHCSEFLSPKVPTRFYKKLVSWCLPGRLVGVSYFFQDYLVVSYKGVSYKLTLRV